MHYEFDFSPIVAQAGDLLMGCLLTLQLSSFSILLAFLVAIPPAAYLHSHPKSRISIPINAFVEVVRNTPFLIQIFFIFFGLPAAGITLDPNVAAVIALTINGTAYAIEIIRGGLSSIHRGQEEAGYALGLSRLHVFRYVVLKPALRAISPALASQFIFLMLTSSIASSITANELTHVAASIEATTFRSFEVYFTVAILYLLMSILLSAVFGLIQRIAFSYPNR